VRRRLKKEKHVKKQELSYMVGTYSGPDYLMVLKKGKIGLGIKGLHGWPSTSAQMHLLGVRIRSAAVDLKGNPPTEDELANAWGKLAFGKKSALRASSVLELGFVTEEQVKEGADLLLVKKLVDDLAGLDVAVPEAVGPYLIEHLRSQWGTDQVVAAPEAVSAKGGAKKKKKEDEKAPAAEEGENVVYLTNPGKGD